MKKNLTSIISLGMTMLLLFALAGCSASIADENQIKMDLENLTIPSLPVTESVDTIEITQRETDKKAEIDTVWCRVESHDDEMGYIKFFVLEYMVYDKNWMLTSCQDDQTDKWASLPLEGVKEEFINNSLIGHTVVVDEEEWFISQENIESVTVDSQETQLEQGKDVLTVTLKVDSDALLAEGQIQLEYVFDNGWKYKDSFVTTPFTSDYKEQAKLELTDDTLMSEIAKQEMLFGEGDSEQSISIAIDEIAEFSILGGSAQNQGTMQTVDCSFTLNKNLVIFTVDAVVLFQYDTLNGWVVQQIDFASKVESVDMAAIEGKWTGHYIYAGFGGYSETQMSLDITEITVDGDVTGIFSDLSSSPFSEEVVGRFNFDKLTFELETLYEPSFLEPGHSFKGYLNTNTSTLLHSYKGDGHSKVVSHAFEIMKE